MNTKDIGTGAGEVFFFLANMKRDPGKLREWWGKSGKIRNSNPKPDGIFKKLETGKGRFALPYAFATFSFRISCGFDIRISDFSDHAFTADSSITVMRSSRRKQITTSAFSLTPRGPVPDASRDGDSCPGLHGESSSPRVCHDATREATWQNSSQLGVTGPGIRWPRKLVTRTRSHRSRVSMVSRDTPQNGAGPPKGHP